MVFAFALAGTDHGAGGARHGAPRLRWLFATAAGTTLALLPVLALLLPPRGEIADPEYYANGPDIPVALRAIEQAQGSARAISRS